MKDILELYLAFLRIGAVNFGGGYAMLPLLERDLVQDRGWTTTQDLTDYFAIGQCTPGLIAGIRVCVCVLIVQAVLRLWKKSVVDKVSLCLYIGVFLMTALSGVLPVAAAILVITSGILGVIIGGFRDNNDNKKEAEKKQ